MRAGGPQTRVGCVPVGHRAGSVVCRWVTGVNRSRVIGCTYVPYRGAKYTRWSARQHFLLLSSWLGGGAKMVDRQPHHAVVGDPLSLGARRFLLLSGGGRGAWGAAAGGDRGDRSGLGGRGDRAGGA